MQIIIGLYNKIDLDTGLGVIEIKDYYHNNIKQSTLTI